MRIGWLAALNGYELKDHLQLDPAAYDERAAAMVGGDDVPADLPYYQAPLYSWFLAAIYKAAGRDFTVVRVVQIILGVASLFFVARIGYSLFDGRTALIAALAGALYAPFPFYETQIMKTALGIFLVTAGIAATIRARGSFGILFAGILLGLSALVRENYLLLLPAGAVAVAWSRPEGDRSWKRALLLLLGGILAVAPVTLHNRAASGEWIAVTSQGGENFFIGNNDRARGVYTPLPFVRPDPRFEQADFRAEGERRAGRALTPVELSRFWYGEAFRWIASSPRAAARLWFTKFLLFWNDLEVPDNENFYYLRDRFGFLRAVPLTFGVIAPFALFGMVVSIRRFRERFLPYAVVGAVLLPLTAFYIFSRYRVGAVPFLLLFAAHGVLEFGAMIARRRTRAALLSAAFLASAWAMTNVCEPIDFDPRADGYVTVHVNRAMLFAGEGETEKALDEYRMAVELDPDNGVIRKKRSALLLSIGRDDAARRDLERAVKLLPADGDVRNDLALLLLRDGNRRRAEELLREAVRVDPAALEARRNLEKLLARGKEGSP